MRICCHKKVDMSANMNTLHISEERKTRTAFIEELMKNENAILIRTFWVDKGHKNGAEIHNIYSNGIIRIYNKRTGRHITDLIARQGQIIRYYKETNIEPPLTVIEMARKHQRKNYNRI